MEKLVYLAGHRSFKGEQWHCRWRSEALGGEIDLLLYLPVSFLRDQPTALLCYLPELGHSALRTAQRSGFQEDANRYDRLVVIPDLYPEGGDRHQQLRRVGARLERLERFFFDELLQLFDSPATATGLLGFGLGGSLALRWAGREPKRFAAVAGLATWAGFSRQPFYDEARDRETLARLDPLVFLPTLPAPLPPLWLAQGDHDPLQGQEINFMALCAALQTQPELQTVLAKGYDHSYYFVQSHWRDQLVFHNDHS